MVNHVVVNQETCPICYKNLIDGSDVVEVHQNGADGINKASVQRGNDVHISSGEIVHSKCRQKYINKKDIKINNRVNLCHQKEVPE